jgi:hypothetical protein
MSRGVRLCPTAGAPARRQGRADGLPKLTAGANSLPVPPPHPPSTQENHMMTRSPAPRLLCALVFAGLAGAASANLSASTYSTAKDEVKAMFKAERDKCDSLSGNAKDVCVERAKGHEKVALAHLEYQHTGKAKDREDYLEARYEAKYELAKEMCDAHSGNAKDTCLADAKAARDKAKADIKANKKIAEAQNDQMEARLKADYKAANERCDALSGNAKDSCQASAKARYFQ